MGWNNSSERQRFEKAQRKQAKKYRELGMSEEQIRAMYEFDFKQFQSNRRFYSHTVSLEPDQFEDDGDDNAVVSDMDTSGEHSRLWWIEKLENPELAKQVKSLSKSELELLTLYVFDGYNQTDLATFFSVSQPYINKRIKKIEKVLLIRL